jgi:hypothetical protein
LFRKNAIEKMIPKATRLNIPKMTIPSEAIMIVIEIVRR